MNSEKTTILRDGEDYATYLPVIDVAEGTGRVMNNKKMYFRLLKRFDVKQMTDVLITSIRENDFPAIKNNAHTLRGVSANLALTELKNLTFAIEEKAKIETQCADMVAALDEAAIRVSQSIETLLKKEDSDKP